MNLIHRVRLRHTLQRVLLIVFASPALYPQVNQRENAPSCISARISIRNWLIPASLRKIPVRKSDRYNGVRATHVQDGSCRGAIQWTYDQNLSTDILQSEFLKHRGFDFDIAHDTQLATINTRAYRDINKYGLLQTMLHNCMAGILQEGDNSVRAADLKGSDDVYQKSLSLFYRHVQEVMMKTFAHIAQLQDVIKRASYQYTLLMDTLVATAPNQWSLGTPPIAVEMESLFRPGRRVRVIWEGSEYETSINWDQVSINADDGWESVEELESEEEEERSSELEHDGSAKAEASLLVKEWDNNLWLEDDKVE